MAADGLIEADEALQHGTLFVGFSDVSVQGHLATLPSVSSDAGKGEKILPPRCASALAPAQVFMHTSNLIRWS